MVLVLPDTSGIGQGIQRAGGAFAQAIGEASKMRNQQKEFEMIFNPQNSAMQNAPSNLADNPEFRDKFLGMVKDYENDSGEMLAPNQLDFLWNAQVQQQQQEQQQRPQSYTPSQLGAIAQRNPQLASMLQQNQLAQQQMTQKESLAKEERAFKENKPYMEHVDTLREAIPNKESALIRIRDALSQGNIKNLRNFLADYSGNEYLRSAPLNDLNSAVKEFFIADMQQLPSGTRLNQFIEKNLMGALESGGRSPESNQKIAEYQQFTIDVGNKEIEIADKIAEKYEKSGLEPPKGFKREVYKQLRPYILEKQKELTQTYRDINQGKIKSKGSIGVQDAKNKIKNMPAGQGNVWMLAPNGEIKRIPRSQIKAAQDAGGKFVK